MRESTVGSCASAGRYSLCTIDGGTCQVGLMVMNFIVSLRRGLRQLDIAADAGIRETAGLHVTGIGEHGLCELEIGFRQRLGREAGKSRDLVVAHLEALCI